MTSLACAVILLLSYLSSAAGALSQDQLDIYDSGIYFFDSNGGVCTNGGAVSSETGSGPLFGLQFPDVASPNDLVTNINNVIANMAPSSPFINAGNLFVSSGQKYNVNPALVAAIAGKEDLFGTVNQPVVTVNKNAFGYGPLPGLPSSGGYAVFPSFTASIDVVTKQIGKDYVQPTGAYYSTSVQDMMQHYSADPSATSATLSFMHKFLDGITESGSGDSLTTSSNQSLDLSSIVSKYGLQSAEVKQIGGSVLGTVNATVPPANPVSVMKLVIADVFLHTNPNLGQAAVIRTADLYNGPGTGSGKPEDPKAGQTGLTLGDMLQQMLNDNSSDTDANVLIDAAGGLPTVQTSANSLGYTHTKIVNYYNHNGGNNQTTASDLTEAMENVYTAAGNNYHSAQDALQGVNHWNINPPPEASKWGGDSQTTGNSAVLDIGSDKFIITLYENANQASGGNDMKNASQDILSQLSASSAQTSFTAGSVSASQCQSTSSYQAGANGYDLSGSNAMAHYYQCEPKWGSQPYGNNTDGSPKSSICEGGCGITSLAMVVATLSDSSQTPLTLAKQYGDAYHDAEGTSWGLWQVAATDYHLQEQDIGVDFNQAAQTIRQGGLVIIAVNSGGGGYFTSGSHLMVIRAVDDQGNFYLADAAALGGHNYQGHDTENTPYSADFLLTHGLMNLFSFNK
ncbi:MAG: C39 family peptidase [Candidatus Saccharimonadales bacterium]